MSYFEGGGRGLLMFYFESIQMTSMYVLYVRNRNISLLYVTERFRGDHNWDNMKPLGTIYMFMWNV